MINPSKEGNFLSINSVNWSTVICFEKSFCSNLYLFKILQYINSFMFELKSSLNISLGSIDKVEDFFAYLLN
jgi:hypothetical protein